MDFIHGNVKQLFYKLLFPAIGGALVFTIYSLVDTIAIGQGVGAEGTAACAVLLPVFCIADFVGFLCGTGGAVLLSEAKGNGNDEKGNAYFTAAFILVMMATAVIWSAMFLFPEELYRFFGADNLLLPYAMDYGKTINLALPSFVLVGFLSCFLRNDGAPKLVLIASLCGGVLNIFGDWLFVFPLQMGMYGAALATVIGSLIQVIIMIGYLFTKRCGLKFVKPYRILVAFKNILVNGFGAAFSSLALIIVTFVANNQIMKYADAASLAVYGMISTVVALVVHIYSGAGQAVQPIASANFGAKNSDRYWHAYRLGVRTVLIFGIAFTAATVLLPSQITALFIKPTPEVVEIAPLILRVYAISFIPLGINTFLSVYLQSIMRSASATVIAVMRGLIVNCSLLYLLPLLLNNIGIWIAFAAAELLVAVSTYIYVCWVKSHSA